MKLSRRIVSLAAVATLAAATPLALDHAASASTTAPTQATTTDLTDPHKKEIAMELVSSAENSSLEWKAQYSYIEDIGDGRGYTAGIIGFCSGTDDMLQLVEYYIRREPSNPLAKFLPALKKVDGTASHAGLGSAFVSAWRTAAADKVFQAAQQEERDRMYFDPAVKQARADGLPNALGEFIYYDAAVMHGLDGMMAIRNRAVRDTRPPAKGGHTKTYLLAYLNERDKEMRQEAAHDDTSRVDTEQSIFVHAGNYALNPPLAWKTYGDPYTISRLP